MNRERVRELWAQALSGERLSGEEEAELLGALRADEALRRELLSDAKTHGLLSAVLRGNLEAEADVRQFRERVASDQDASRFVQKVESHIAGSKPATTWRAAPRRRRPDATGGTGAWTISVAAAGVLFGIVILLSLSTPESPRPAPAGDREAKSRAERVAEPMPEALEEARARVEAQRKRAEARLQEIERERAKLTHPEPQAVPTPIEEEKRKENLAKLESEKARIEREMREAIEKARQTEPAPAPIPERPADASKETRAAVAKLERVEGEVYVVSGGARQAAKGGVDFLAGQRVDAVGERSLAVLVYPDRTRVEVGPETELAETTVGRGKRLQVVRGTVRAEVTRQPSDRPLVMATPHAEATVLGTTLRIHVDLDPRKGTRLEVEEGKVRLKRLGDGRTVEVPSGHHAVAAVGLELAARPSPVEEILLLPLQAGAITGDEWLLAKDEQSVTGHAFQALDTRNKEGFRTAMDAGKISAWFTGGRSRSWVAFSFRADADKEYRLWVRGRCLATGDDRGLHDSVMVEAVNAQFTRRPADWPAYADTLCTFSGYAHHPGYVWSGGFHDPGRTDTPIAIRFSRTGLQHLKMHALETPVRIDAIRLSVSQTTRPGDEDFGPLRKKRGER